MKKVAFILLGLVFCMASCEKESIATSENDQTLLMYFPWSNTLLSVFRNNISDMESAIAGNILKNERVVVFLQTSTTEAVLFELKYNKGKCIADTLKYYTNPAVTRADGITAILNDVQSYAPARRYAMSVGSHGMAWIPVSGSRAADSVRKNYWDYEAEVKTRYFGGTETAWQTNTTTLAEGIANAGIKMEYILMDVCHMSSVEVAYDLKEVTGYLIGCPTEIIDIGMPFADIGQYMLGDVNYEGICNGFLTFYENYTRKPCGTIGVTNCSELSSLAAIMKEINANYTFDTSLLGSLQVMDGYSPSYFFDLGDYVSKLCTDAGLLAEFEAQLERVIPTRYRKHTEYFYTAQSGGRNIRIDTYTGLTTSDPSISPTTSDKTGTAWYAATH